jgi:hypothetical protein
MRGQVVVITTTSWVSWSLWLGTWEALLMMVTRAEVRSWKHLQKTSDASGGSQRGHSTLSAGKPRTWGRATACQVRQSTMTPLYTRESWLGGGKETTVMVLAGGRRVR